MTSTDPCTQHKAACLKMIDQSTQRRSLPNALIAQGGPCRLSQRPAKESRCKLPSIVKQLVYVEVRVTPCRWVWQMNGGSVLFGTSIYEAHLQMFPVHQPIFIDSVLTSFAPLCKQASCLPDITFFWLCQSFFTYSSSVTCSLQSLSSQHIDDFHHEVHSCPRARRLYRCR